MSAKAARGPTRILATAASHRHSGQVPPEQLEQEIERLRRENEQLREQLAERERQRAEDQKKIVELERQLAGFQKDSSNSSKPPLHGRKGSAPTLSSTEKEQTETGRAEGTPGQTSSPGASGAGRSGGGGGSQIVFALWNRVAVAG